MNLNCKSPALTNSYSTHCVGERDGRLRITAPSPSFIKGFDSSHDASWATVVSDDTFSYKQDWLLPALADEHGAPPLFDDETLLGDKPFSSFDGTVLLVTNRYSTQFHLPLLKRVDAFRRWFARHDIQSNISDAGRTLSSLIDVCGGILRTDKIAKPNIIQYLDELQRSANGACSAETIKIELGHKGEGSDHWKHLLEMEALEPGLLLPCSHCQAENWKSLSEIQLHMTCSHCLSTFSFPKHELVDKKGPVQWGYKLKGPFATPGYAKGAFSTALTLRYLAINAPRFNNNDFQWCPSIDLQTRKGKLESDFALWQSQSIDYHWRSKTKYWFGECKSFGANCFQPNNFTHMRNLAQHFPGCAIVFATLKNFEEFSEDEISLFREFRDWCNMPSQDKFERNAHLIILTGKELFEDNMGSMEPASNNSTFYHEHLSNLSSKKYPF